MVFKILAMLMAVIGICLVFELTPDSITDGLLRVLKPKNTIAARSAALRGKEKQSAYLRLIKLKNALKATGKTKNFSVSVTAAVVLMFAGAASAVILNNIFLLPVFCIACGAAPFMYLSSIISAYEKQIADEMETTLSAVTNSYLRSEDIISSVKENLKYIKPPLYSVFEEFLTETEAVSPDIKAALINMSDKTQDGIFKEWVLALVRCQDDRTLKDTLLPIVARLSDVRRINTELSGILRDAKNEYLTPAEEIPIGSLIIFKHKTTGEIAHLALYAGYYAGKHFVTHVGNERGPEISTVEGMSKGSYPEVVAQVAVPDIGEPTGTISVYKTDENGKPLAGAKFKVTMAEHPEYSFLINPTDENGNAKMNMGLPYGKYILTEIEFPEGYTYSGQKEYTVEICDETQFVTVRAVNRLKSSKLTVIKVDSETGQTVKGVTGFKLKNTKTGEESEVYYTDENGSLTLPSEITYGNYELTEVVPPNGYVLNTTPVSFGIDGNTPEVVIRLSDKPEKGKISVLKKGEMFSSVEVSEDRYVPVFSEKGLKGAEFEVTAAEDIYTADGTLRISKGALADTLVTDESGEAESKELYPGKYLLREISAPEGYILNAEPREITVVSGVTSAEIFNERKKQEFKLKKELETDQKFGIGFNGKILNIRFGLFSKTELTALDGSIIPADGLIEVATPDEDGFICFAADMPYNAECYIKELETDKHYILSDEQYLSGDTVKNKIIRGSIEGLKTDPNGRVLRGAVIGLFYPFETEFSKDTAIETFETDEAGRFLFENVPYGDWIIRELKAPDGYILSDENYTVTVKENGETVKLNIKNSKIPEPPSAPESPKTGDTANLLIPSAALFTALAAVIYLSKKLKKRGYINE